MTRILLPPSRRRATLLAVLAIAVLTVPAWSGAGVGASSPLDEAGCDHAALRSTRDVATDAFAFFEPAEPRDHDFAFESCTGKIRPGARMTSPVGCTFNFVFTDDAENLYIGTAAHCTPRTGTPVAARGVGFFGTVVFVKWQGTMDFALIRVDADKHHLVDPTLCAWGGPRAGPDPGSDLEKDVLLEYGWGIATFLTPQTRARALAETMTDAGQVYWSGVGSGGDSGAPLVNQAGYPVAIHTRGLTPIAGVALESGPHYHLILEAARTAIPSLRLVPGDTTNLEDTMAGMTYGSA